MDNKFKEALEKEAIAHGEAVGNHPLSGKYPIQQATSDFINGAKWAKEYLGREAHLLRWVKASEAPKEFGMYHVTLEDGDKNRMGGFIEFNEERGWLTGEFGDDAFVTEWLEENINSNEQKEKIKNKFDNWVNTHPRFPDFDDVWEWIEKNLLPDERKVSEREAELSPQKPPKPPGDFPVA